MSFSLRHDDNAHVSKFIHPAVSVTPLPRARASAQRARDAFRRREQGRVRRHFRDVLAELEAKPTIALTDAQRARRHALLADLATYRRASRFPRNADFHGRRAPYFIDAQGTRCAVAHLMEQSGAVSLMERIARDQNNAYVRELARDREIGAWLASVGLTLEEAARIQPDYCDFGTNAEICCSFAENSFPPAGAVEGKVESIDAMAATVLVRGGAHGRVDALENDRVVLPGPPSNVEVGDAVLVLFDTYGVAKTLRVDSKDRVATPCDGFQVPPTVKKETMLAIADGAECADTLHDEEADEWEEYPGRCSCDCNVGPGDGSASVGVALVMIAAASARFRWRGRRARREARR